MKVFLSLQQKLDIIHKAYLVLHAMKSTAFKYNVDPNQNHRWKASLTGLDEKKGQHQLALLTSFKGQAKKTFHSGKVCIDTAHYGAIQPMFNTLHNPDQHISVMTLTVELRRTSGALVSFLVLSKHVSCWLASVHITHCSITNIAQNTCHCEVTMQDLVAYINSKLSQGQYSWQCVVNNDETNIFLNMESGLTLANKGVTTVSIKITGSQ